MSDWLCNYEISMFGDLGTWNIIIKHVNTNTERTYHIATDSLNYPTPDELADAIAELIHDKASK